MKLICVLGDRAKQNRAFTLIETVIYTALVAMILVSFVSFSFFMNGVKNKNYLVDEVNNNARQVLEFISEQVKSADAIISPAPGQEASSLVLSDSGAQKTIYLDNDIALFSSGGEIKKLSADKIKISNLKFVNLSLEGDNPNLWMSLSAQNKQGEGAYFEYENNLHTSISLRR